MNQSSSVATLSPSIVPKWSDAAGLIASIGCAIHCAAMPLIIGYLPMLGLDWVATQGFHQGMAIICSLIAIAAFVPGWRKHKRLVPTALGLIGIALLTSHAFGAEDCCATGCGTETVCCEQACEECVETDPGTAPTLAASVSISQESTANNSPTDIDADASLWSRLSWYVTPLGGFFLVCAHLVNHRLGCLCCSGEQPCGTEVVD